MKDSRFHQWIGGSLLVSRCRCCRLSTVWLPPNSAIKGCSALCQPKFLLWYVTIKQCSESGVDFQKRYFKMIVKRFKIESRSPLKPCRNSRTPDLGFQCGASKVKNGEKHFYTYPSYLEEQKEMIFYSGQLSVTKIKVKMNSTCI